MLSIIVPVYNVQAYIIRCLESLDRQTVDDLEIIIVNDGTTDNSAIVCEEFIKDKPKFKLYHKKNGGLMSAWMYGVEQSTGDYIGFVDSDDYVSDDMFQRLYGTAENLNVDIVMCDRFDVINEVEYPSNSSCVSPGLYQNENMAVIYENILPKFNGSHITNARWNKVFRRNMIVENMKYCLHRSKVLEDRFIVPSAIFSAKSFYYLNEPLYFYMHRAGSNHSMAVNTLQKSFELLDLMQHQALVDKNYNQKYLDLLERANLNYIRLLIMRNFAGNGNNQERVPLAKALLNDFRYQNLVNKWNSDLTGKLGQFVRFSFYFKNVKLFVFICSKFIH